MIVDVRHGSRVPAPHESVEHVIDERTRTEAATIAAVRRLLADRHMAAAFQPIWNLETRRVIGYEGLARPGEEYGFTTPYEAFAGAARLGRIEELDALCRQAVLAQLDGFPGDVLLFLNLAPEVFDHDDQMGRRLQREVAAAGMRPEQVVLDLTEIAGERLDLAQVRGLGDLGFHLALDDVGSGDSGPGLLGAVRPEYVKVDREVLFSARDGGPGSAVLTAVVTYAARSGAIVIAEGIETEEILHRLLSETRRLGQGAHLVGGQGYLLGRPSNDPGWRAAEAARWPLSGSLVDI
ncbi:EAL domain-containing protein [Pengzhenrongella sp.]|jgi:EAL domain-containing protein (putative c-di-GMP-specific phosphodiesterase class I)|uniref:EAL domain-containing protein n=1 Tax=Pengzhenrongella sp. TaxID=2888820 RepID=UPI002F94C2FF